MVYRSRQYWYGNKNPEHSVLKTENKHVWPEVHTCTYYIVRIHVPPEAAHFSALGVLCCFALFVCLTLLVSFFLPSHLSLKTCIRTLYMYMYMTLCNVCTKVDYNIVHTGPANKPIYVDIQCHVHLSFTYTCRCVVTYYIVCTCTCTQCILFGTTCCVLVSTGHCPGSLRLQHGSQDAGWCRQCGQCSEWSEYHTQQDGGRLGRRPARS